MADSEAVVLSAMATRYQQAFSRVHIATELAALDAWYSLGSFAGEDEDEWVERFWVVISAGALAASGLTYAYLRQSALALGEDVGVLPLDQGWLREDFDKWAQSPMVKARWDVSEGVPSSDALLGGGARVSKLASAAVRESEQRALLDFDLQVEASIVFEGIEVVPNAPRDATRVTRTGSKAKYKRIPQAGACGFCLVAADRVYGAKAVAKHPLGTFHTFCRCTWRRLTTNEAKSFDPRYTGGAWKDVIDVRSTPSQTGA